MLFASIKYFTLFVKGHGEFTVMINMYILPLYDTYHIMSLRLINWYFQTNEKSNHDQRVTVRM